MDALSQKEFDGRDLRLRRVIRRTSAYVRHFVTYRSGNLEISGIMNVPRGKGPFPVVVMAHGYFPPDVYTNGRGLAREQHYLASRGYAVLHTDYRNYAQSDVDRSNELELRLGYTDDVINAVLAVKGSGFAFVDKNRVGLLGRSMGGGVALNVVVCKPGLVDAAIIYAPVSSSAVDNFDKWTSGTLRSQIIARYGSAEDSPDFWRGISPVSYFDRITEPIQIHHGTADTSCPIRWTHRTKAALEQAGKNVTLHTYRGEPHTFVNGWTTSIRRSATFLGRYLR